MFPNKINARLDRKLGILSCVALCLVLTCAAYLGFKRWESNSYRGLIPPEVGVANALLIEGKSGFMEGCGVAIFRLTPQMRERIKVQGLAAFDGSLDQKDHVRPSVERRRWQDEMRSWEETPYVETGDGTTMEDSWQVGFSCADQTSDLVRSITDALRQPGSFVRKLHEAAVVVVPALGVAAFVHNG
ncbi:hypothetical protein [Massilia sp. TN1-12]|uniref:hypothetical protein n=1 Tax=Massilia paldalensis TaxID=3377675 RepID=UPI003850FD26